MSAPRHQADGRRIKLFHGLIRMVRGKPLLEALYRLQGGTCAYDSETCVLLLPQTVKLYSRPHELHAVRHRFATVDHVVPRCLGGHNHSGNIVMAAQVRNNEKGCLAPLGRWVPARRHTDQEVARMVRLVEQTRHLLAQKLANDRRLNKQDVLNKLIARELYPTSPGREFKFYESPIMMVA